MGKFSENRKYLFEKTSPITPNSTKLTPLHQNGVNIKKRNWMQNLIQIGNESQNCENSQQIQENNKTNTGISYSKCCESDHISQISSSDRNSILDYYINISQNHNRANDYLKGLVIPQAIKRRRMSKNESQKPKSKSFEYFIELKTGRKKVCKTAFCQLHNITKSRLNRKVLTNRESTEDLRGKHQNQWNKIPQEVVDDVNDFIDNLPARESHYSPKTEKTKKYLNSDLNISKLYNNFISIYPEYDKVVSYDFFKYHFKKFNIGFGFPRSDICSECELFSVKLNSLEKPSDEHKVLQENLDKHLSEAQKFYEFQNEVKNLIKKDNTISAISMDFEKNLPLPVSKVSFEYYLRQLWLQNFCIHDMSSGQSNMFLYSEHYANKGPNEVISLLNFYFSSISNSIKTIYIFSDNSFSQNKNRYIWFYYLILIKLKKFDQIILIYPTPGHSYLDCDRDFGRIEKNRLKIQKVRLPSDWVKLIKETDHKMPFKINYVNHPLTDDLKYDETPVIKVKNFKNFSESLIVSKVDNLSKMRKIKFTQNGIFGTLNLLSENFNLALHLTENYSIYENFSFESLNDAYDDFLPIKKAKYNDVMKLLKFVEIPENSSFYNTLKYIDSDLISSKTSERIYNLIENEVLNEFCECNGKCIRTCNCKKLKKNCNENCKCKISVCMNKI
jgi:hypothetical protein